MANTTETMVKIDHLSPNRLKCRSSLVIGSIAGDTFLVNTQAEEVVSPISNIPPCVEQHLNRRRSRDALSNVPPTKHSHERKYMMPVIEKKAFCWNWRRFAGSGLVGSNFA